MNQRHIDPMGSSDKPLNQRRKHLRLVVVHHVTSVFNAGDFQVGNDLDALVVLR